MSEYTVVLTNALYGKKRFIPTTLLQLEQQLNLSHDNVACCVIDSQGLTSKQHIAEIENAKADLLGISFMSDESATAYLLTARLKNSSGPLIIHGGVHPSHYSARSLFSGADYVCKGEGESSLPLLVGELKTGNPPEQRVLFNGMITPDDIQPIREWPEGLEAYGSRFVDGVQIPLYTSRNCIGRCAFCMSGNESKDILWYSEDHVLKSVDAVVDSGYRHISFFDNDFFLHMDRTLVLAEKIHKRHPHLGWDCLTSVNSYRHHAGRVAEAIALGMEGLHIGIESLSDTVLKRMRKAQTAAQGEAVLKSLLDLSIPIKEPLFVSLYEEDTPEAHQRVARTLTQAGIASELYLQWHQFATPLPGTEFARTASQYGTIIDNGMNTSEVHFVPHSFARYPLSNLRILDWLWATDNPMYGLLLDGITQDRALEKIAGTNQELAALTKTLLESVYEGKLEVVYE